MPGTSRRNIYDPRVRNIIHAWNGFARELFMVGYDARTREQNSHRLRWMLNTEAVFARYFAVDVRTTAIMGNHYHVVFENRPDIVRTWSNREVVVRWLTITKLKVSGGAIAIAPTEKRIQIELEKGAKRIKTLRKRLANPSWFMGAIGECISRQINREEQLKGTCWQGRFKCRVAEGEQDVLNMMMYVDLNPLRAKCCPRIEDLPNSGAGLRLRAFLARRRGAPYPLDDVFSAEWLSALYLDERRPLDDPIFQTSRTGMRASDRGVFWFSDFKYYGMLDLAARELREGKRGVTPPEIEPIYERLGMTSFELSKRIEQYGQKIR